MTVSIDLEENAPMSERSARVRVLRMSLECFASWCLIRQTAKPARVAMPWQRNTTWLLWFAICLLVPLLSLAPVAYAQDMDGDTILDAADLDDDNDGVLDLLEGHSTGNTIVLDTTPTLLSGTGTIGDAQVGDFILYDDAVTDGVTTFDVVVEVIAIQRDLAAEILDFSTTRFFEIGSLIGEKFDSNQDEHVIVRLYIVEDGSATVGNPTGTPATLTNVTFTFGDLDSEGGRNMTEVFGYSTATPPDTVTLPGAPSLLENAGFVGAGGPGAGYNFYRMRRDVAGNPGNWTDEPNTAANPDVSVELFFSTLSQLEIVFGVTGFNVGVTRRGAVVSSDATIDLDMDNDGVANRFDLDSDNDGISDLIESGQDAAVVDLTNDGVHDGGINGSGVPSAANGGAGVIPVNSDVDSIANILDLDSDNDGIPDNVEAQATLTYVAPLGPIDANGVNASGLFLPVNTDGDGLADYIDTDSDNDGTPDSTESGLTPGADTNGDGIGDGINASYADVNGDINDPATDLASGGGEVDFRNARPTAAADSATTASGNTVMFSVTGNDTDADGTIDATTVDLDPGTAGQQTTLAVAGEGSYSVDASGNVTFIADLSFSGTAIITYTVTDNDGAMSDPANITITVQGIDYGDAPDTGAGTGTGNYRTTAADGGASHIITGPFLGGCVDADDGTLQGPLGNADDITVGLTTSGTCLVPGSDERGVITTVPGGSFIPGQTVAGFVVLMSGSPSDCQLDAWFDFNQNGDFSDPGEQIASGLTLLTAIPLTSLNVSVPADTLPGTTYARFRCTSAGIATPDGPAPDGEVEDYPVSVLAQSDLSITQTDSIDPANPGAPLVYTMTVSNAGPSVARDVVVTNTLPAGVTFVSTSGCAEDPTGDGTCTLGSIAVGGSAQYTLTVNVDVGTTGTLNHVVSVSTSSVDLNLANNSSTESTVVNNPPVAVNDIALTQINTPVMLDVAANDSDSDGTVDISTIDLDPGTAGQQITVTVAGEGTFSKAPDGIVTFTPEPGFTGGSVITYTIDDNNGATSNAANIAVTINAPPTAVDDSTLTQINTNVTIDITSNDNDTDGNVDDATVDLDPLTAGQQMTLLVAGEGTFSADGAGNVTFMPVVGFTGMSVASYTVNDNDGGLSNTATITITINAPPVAADDSALTQIDVPVAVNIVANDTDTDGTIDAATVDLDPVTAGQQNSFTIAGQGTFSDDGAGNVTFTPVVGFTGAPTATYTVNDNDGGLSNTATITIDVNAQPVAVDDTTLTQINTPITLNVTANDTDADGTINTATVDLDPATAGQQNSFTVAGQGTFADDGAGNVTFTPEPTFTGLSSATYTVNDNDGGLSNTATITITVNAQPVAVDDSTLTQIDVPVTLSVIANDTDADGTIDPATVDLDPATAGQQNSFTVAGQGTFSDDGAGNVTFTPVAGFTGMPTATYTVNDNDGGLSNTATITITVNAQPVAVDDSTLTQIDVPVTLNVIANDTDADGTIDPATVDLDPATAGQQNSFTVAGQGTFADDGAGNVTFTPVAGFTGMPTATYTVNDNDGGTSNTATITIDVNAQPVAVDDSALTQIDVPVTLSVIANDTDADGTIDAATVDLDPATAGQQNSFTVAGQGTFADDGAGNITFTPVAGFTGMPTASYTVNDNDGGLSNTATITIDVNAQPVAVDDSALTQIDVPVTLSVIANDTDADGTIDAATVDLDPATAGQQNSFTVAGQGTFADDGAGNVTFTPVAGFTGMPTATYTVNDNDGGLSNTATITIDVNAQPVAVDDSTLTQIDVPVTVNVIANDTDADGTIDAATVDLDPATAGQQNSFTVAGQGTFADDGAGNVTFTPVAGFTGMPTATYTVNDNDGGLSNTATITIDVNAQPVAVDDSTLTQIDVPVTLNVIANDTDADGTIDAATVDLDPATAGQQNSFTVAGQGTFADDGAGNVTFTPVAGFTGMPTATYTVNDNDGGTSNAATITIDVNAQPVAVDDSALTQIDVPVTLSVIANDTDADGTIDAATVDLDPATAGQQNSFTVAGQGTFADDGAGNVTFTPVAGFTGMPTASYTVNDNDGGLSNTATITIDVNAQPVAVDDSTLTQIDVPVTLNVIANDTDADGTIDAATVDLDPATAGQQNSFTIAGQGTFADDGAGNITFTPVAGFTGMPTATYTVNDNDGGTSNAATITIDVNAQPVAVDDSALTQIDVPVTVNVIANDTDADGTIDAATVDLDPATAGQQNSFTIAGQGTFADDGAGNVTFTPVAGFTGIPTATYTVNDNDGGTSNAATITITVNGQPVATDDAIETRFDTAVTLNVIANDTDADGTIDAATVDLDPATAGQQNSFTVAGQGTFADDGAGNVTFTPEPGFFGLSAITYTVNDNDGGASNAATISITVNEPPVATADTAETALNAPVTFSVTANDTDGDGTVDAATVDLDPATAGQQTTLTVVTQGTFSVDAAGNVTFTPEIGFIGVSTIAYTVNDDDSDPSNNASITVTVLDDTDRDGVPDLTDVDDDNDGIPDTAEGCTERLLNGAFASRTGADWTDWTETGNLLSQAGGVYFDDDNAVASIEQAGIVGWDPITASLLISMAWNDSPVDTGDPAILTVSVDGTAYMTMTTPAGDGVNATISYLNGASGNLIIVPETANLNWVALAGRIDLPAAATTGSLRIEFDMASLNTGGPNDDVFIDNVSVIDCSNLPDHDSDEAINALDLDSDNDAIPDIVEAGGTDVDGDAINDNITDTDGDRIPDSVDVDVQGAADTDADGIIDTADVDADGDGIPENGTDSDGDGINNANDPDANGDGLDDLLAPPNDTAPGLAALDFDTDGQPNHLDVDSDNDGIPDTLEAGGTDSNGDGEVDYPTPGEADTMLDTDGDGLSDDFDNLANGPFLHDGSDIGDPLVLTDAMGNAIAGAASSMADIDPDLDIAGANWVDLDADDDTIPDNIEWQTTTGYLDPASAPNAGDGNGDGWAYDGTVVSPVDTDGDATPDYLDEDSDNDFFLDRDESGLPDSGVDADSDGIVDSVNASRTDVNGDVNDPNTDLSNAGGFGEVDFRNIIPVANADDIDPNTTEPYITTTNTALMLSVTDNDSDADGIVNVASVDLDPFTPGQQTVVTLPGVATLIVDALGNVTMTPALNFFGDVVAPYTVDDNDGATSNPANITIHVNNPPTAVDDTAVTQVNTPVTLPAVIFNDLDFDGAPNPATVDLDPATAGIQQTFTVAGQGTFVVNPINSDVTFTPEPGYFGTTTISYTVEDNDSALSNAANIIVRVNEPPVAVADTVLTQLNTPVTLAVTANDTDGDGTIDTATVDLDPATAGIQSTLNLAGQGVFADDGAGNVTFTPDPAFTGLAAITYVVGDNDGATSNAAAISVTVNAPPTAADDTVLTQINTAVTLSVTANDTDADGTIDAATVDLDTGSAGQQITAIIAGEGIFAADGVGNVTFTPEAGFTGISTIAYTVNDNDGGTSNNANITVTVNAPPVANADSTLTQLDTPVTINVTTNDTDSDGNVEIATVDLNPGAPGRQTLFTVINQGVFSVDGAGVVTFSPEAGFTGTSTATYTIEDNDGGISNAATITVTVNEPPEADDDDAVTPRDRPITTNVTTNDEDDDGTIDAATVDLDPNTAGRQTTFTVAGEGTYTVDNAGNVTFTPVLGFVGTSTAAYVVNDNDGGTSNSATITITVQDGPAANNDSALTLINTPVTIDVTANDIQTDNPLDTSTIDLDPNTPGQQTTVVVAGEGTFTFAGAGLVTFTPEPGFAGETDIMYTVSDSVGTASNAAEIEVEVNIPPVAVADSAETPFDTPITVDASNNDSDADGSLDLGSIDLDPNTPGQQTIVTVAGECTFSSAESNGTVIVTPDATFSGICSITYTINDDDGATSEPTTISVRVNTPPEAADDSASTPLNTPVGIPVLVNDSDEDGDPIQITAVSPPANGSVTFTPTGQIVFTPTPGFTGTDIFTYTIDDGRGDSDTAFVSVTVDDQAVNNLPPTAVADQSRTPIDTPVTINVLVNDFDPDNDPLTLSAITAVTTQGGAAAINDGGTPGDPSDDTVVYTPAAGFTGTDHLTYTIDDGQGGTDTAIVTIEVLALAADPIPTANGDGVSTPHDVAVTIDVLANDTHPTPDPLTITLATQGANGTVSISDNGTPGDPSDDSLLYTPNAGFVGHDTLMYTIVDANGDDARAAVSITVTNVPPVAADDSTLTQIDTPASLAVTANDTDSDGTVDAATVDLDPNTAGRQTTFSVAGQGAFTVDGSGTVTFTPEAGFTGTSSITYTVDDETAGTSAPGTISVRVNAPPVAVDDNMVTPIGTVVTQALLSNDSDSDGTIDATTVDLDPSTAGQQTTFAVAGQGTFSVDATGTVTFTPEPGFVGLVNASYRMNDNDGGISNTANITVDVRPGPAANHDNAVTVLNTPVTLDITANDVASDNPLNLASVDLDPNTPMQQTAFAVVGEGVYSVDGSGNVTFTPEAGFAGISMTTYTIADTVGTASNIATISILVNIPPVAAADSAITQIDTPITINVTDNDTDADGTVDVATVDLDPNTAGRQTALTIAGQGSFSADNAGNVTFTPDAGFTGPSTAAYTVDDNLGANSNAANITITVNAPPVAADDAAFTQQAAAVTLTVTDNDSDTGGTIDTGTVDLDPDTVGRQTSSTVPGEGVYSVDASGAVTFTPNSDFFGISTRTYTVMDNDGGTSNPAMISIEVNARPVAQDDSGNTAGNTAIAIPILVNDYDPDDDPIRVTAVNPPANGAVTFTPEGELIYTPNAGFTGIDTLIYTIEDNRGGSDTATITIMVGDTAAVNLPPTAIADQSTTERDTPISIAVLTNDYDPDGDPLTLSLATPNTDQGGTAIVEDGGTPNDPSDDTVRYTPAPGFTGIDTLTYIINDGQGNSDTAIVTIRVTDPAAPKPTANGDSATTRHDHPVTIDVLMNDIPADMLTLTTLTNGANGTVSLDDGGTPGDPSDDQVIYMPNPLFVGPDTFTYTVTDTGGNTAIAAVTVIVTNAPPLANDDSAQTPANTDAEIPVLVNDHDRDGDTLTLITTSGNLPGGITTLTPSNGTLVNLDAIGHVTYRPNPGFSGTDTFVYQVCDPIGACDTAVASVTVSPPGSDNAPPTAVADNSITPLDTPVAITVLPNDFEPDGEPLSITPVVDQPTVEGGSFTVLENSQLLYTPPFGFAGTDTLEYEICDPVGNCDTALVFVEVQPAGADPGPMPVGDGSMTPEGVPVTINVIVNDSHPTGDTLTIVEYTNGAHGTVTPVNGMLVYTPEPGFVGHDVFTYTVEDSTGDRTRAAVSVNVVNGQPAAVNDTVTTGVERPIEIDVLANDTDPNGDPLTVLSIEQPVGGTATINADGTVTFIPDEDRREPASFVYTISDGNGGTSSATVTVNFVELFAAPMGEKTINPQDFPELEWRIVWINNSNGDANAVRVTDPIDPATTFIPGTLTCDAMGSSTVTRCDYDSATNQVIVDGNVGPDPGATSEAAAANEVVITFRVSVPIDFFGTVENQSVTYWDADGDGMVDDDIIASPTQPALSDDPLTPEPNDPTVGTFAPGACLFQVRPVIEIGDSEADEGPEATGDPTEGGFEGTDARQGLPSPLALTTPSEGQVVAGSSVAVAAVQGPSIGTTLSQSIRITVDNNDAQITPDITEDEGLKTEILPAAASHTVVTETGLLVSLAEGAMASEDTLEVKVIDAADLPQPLPGEGVTNYYQLTLTGGRTQLDQALTLRLPYSDIDQNSQIDGTTLSETALTLWRYVPSQGIWEHVSEAMVIPETDVVVATTDRIGLLGVFRAADGRLATLGSADDDVVTLGTALNAVTDSVDNEGWFSIGEARRAPHVVAWDTTALEDGDYDLRVVCALDSALLSAFETEPVTQLSGDNRSSSNCFIATAAYGSPWQSQVRILRDFRDTYLTSHRPGRWLVDQYYRLSPPLADFIRERDGLRAAARVVLTPLVWVAQLTRTVLGWALLVELLLVAGIGFRYWRRHRRRQAVAG